MGKYNVGDIVYVVSREDNRVIPVRVVEEVNLRTLQGEKQTYHVQIGPTGAKPLADIEKLPGTVFRTASDVKKFMLDNAARAVDALIRKAAASASKWYGQGDLPETAPEGADLLSIAADDDPVVTVEQAPDGTTEAEGVEVMLPDGRKVKARARVKVSPPKQ